MDQTKLATEYANLGAIYDPQRAIYNQQIAALPAQYEAQKSALEQAKINAFKDISDVSQKRGVYFSGFRPEQMATYTGTKYLPALAGLATQQQTATTALQQALAGLEGQQRTQAYKNLAAQQNAEYDYQVALAKAKSGSGTSTAKAPSLSQIKASAAADARTLFTESKGKAKEGYTEASIIPQLQTLYPELSAQQIYDIVYPARQIVWGS